MMHGMDVRIIHTNCTFSMQLPFCGFGSSPSTCPPESLEDKENSSPAKCLLRDAERIHCSSPLAEKKPTFLVGADDTNSQVYSAVKIIKYFIITTFLDNMPSFMTLKKVTFVLLAG